jgi:hypothetical protein
MSKEGNKSSSLQQEPPSNILQPIYELVDNRQSILALKSINSYLQKYKNSNILKVNYLIFIKVIESTLFI